MNIETAKLIELTHEHYRTLENESNSVVLSSAWFAIEKNERELETRALSGDKLAADYLLAQCEEDKSNGNSL